MFGYALLVALRRIAVDVAWSHRPCGVAIFHDICGPPFLSPRSGSTRVLKLVTNFRQGSVRDLLRKFLSTLIPGPSLPKLVLLIQRLLLAYILLLCLFSHIFFLLSSSFFLFILRQRV